MKKYNITVNGNTYEVIVEEVGSGASAPVYTPAPAYTPTPVATAPKAQPERKAAAPAGAVGANSVTAPMPGTILEVKVSAGQAIKKGDVICVLEAMKMENEIPAPCDGVVASVNVQKGATVAANDIIASIN